MNKSINILLVEDEEILAESIQFNLEKAGYEVKWVGDGNAALEAFATLEPDLVILDIMIPYIDGFEVARQMRQKSPHMPILMLTALTSVKDRVKGLEIGADDYMTKPFHLEELLARIKAMLRRKQWYGEETVKESIYSFGDNKIDFRDFSCHSQNRDFRLTQREAMIMKYLIQHEGEIVSRETLLEEVWNISSEVETRTVDNFIARLRKYFEKDPKHPVFIKSVRSAGYIFQGKTENE